MSYSNGILWELFDIHLSSFGGNLDPNEAKERARKKFLRTGRGRRQDHATLGNAKRRDEWDDIEDKIRFAIRRMLRNLGDDNLELD